VFLSPKMDDHAPLEKNNMFYLMM